jgi:hypothetical protein
MDPVFLKKKTDGQIGKFLQTYLGKKLDPFFAACANSALHVELKTLRSCGKSRKCKRVHCSGTNDCATSEADFLSEEFGNCNFRKLEKLGCFNDKQKNMLCRFRLYSFRTNWLL